MNVAEMALTLFAVNKGYMDDVDVKKTLAFEAALASYIKGKHGDLLDKIQSTGDMAAETEGALAQAIEAFKSSAVY